MGIKSEQKFKYETEACWSIPSSEMLYLHTGDWRTERPVVDKEKCNICGICVTYCPCQCFVDDGDYYAANLEFCKGCGVCAKECPKKAINMMPEGDYADDCPVN